MRRIKDSEVSDSGEVGDQFYRSVYENVAVACLVIQPDGSCSHCNPAFEYLAGKTSASLKGVPFIEYIHQDEVDHFQELYNALLSCRINSFEIENRWVCDKRKVSWVKCSLSLVAEPTVGDKCVIVQVVDISRKKRIRAQLRNSERALMQFFENAPIGMLWLDASGLTTRMNHAMLELLGSDEASTLGAPLSNWLPRSDLSKILQLLQGRRKVENYRARLEVSSGSKLYVLVDVVSIYEEDEFVRTDWFFRDISMRVDLEQQIIQASENKRRKLGHELHDGLGQVLHGAYFIASSMKQKLERNGHEALLDMSRITSCLTVAMTSVRSIARGLQPVAATPEGLVSALTDHTANVESMYGIQCHFNCVEQIEIHDPNVATHLFRIAQESIANALKHAQCQRISVVFSRKGRALVLAISDDGISKIPEHSLSRGMGLRVMQFRANSIGAELSVERNLQGGTEVCCNVDAYSNQKTT